MLKINFLGDSITCGEKATSPEKGFVNLVGKMLPAEVRNYGISGTRFARQRTPSEKSYYDLYFSSRVKDMNHDADLVFVFGGTNDYGHGDAPIGKMGDKTVDTFYGAVDELINELLKYYKKEQIIFIVPLYRYDELNPYGSRGTAKKVPGPTLPQYRSYMLEVLNKYEMNILDIKDQFGKAEGSDLFEDFVHPNDKGHQKLAELVVRFIKEIINN